MQIKRTNTSETETKLIIIANEQEMASMKQHVLGHFKDKVKIAGFREGKAPLDMIEKSVDPSLLQTEFLEDAVNQLYGKAVQEEQLRPIANPEINIKKFVPFTTLEFEATITVMGDVTLPDYTKVKKQKPEVKITADDVKDVLKNLQSRAAEKNDVERAAKLGDQVWIDFAGKDTKGKAVDGAEGKDYPIILGSNTFIPGFEDNLLDMKAKDEKTFDVTFPADYHAKALAKKKVSFTVTVNKVQEVVEPKLDNTFAATVGPFETLQQLKDDIKTQLQLERQNEADRQFESELVGELAEKTKVALPKSLVEEQIDKIEEQERQSLVYRGQTWEEHLKEENVTAEQHREQKRGEAEKSIRASLMLAEVAEKEKLEFTTEEVQSRIDALKKQYTDPQMQSELDKPENQRDIASRILTEKTVAKLVEYATKK
jgi:trigger factor